MSGPTSSQSKAPPDVIIERLCTDWDDLQYKPPEPKK